MSLPFLIWDTVQLVIKNDKVSSLVFGSITLIYFGGVGELIGLSRIKFKNIGYWTILVILLVINIIAYKYSIEIVTLFETGIRNIFK